MLRKSVVRNRDGAGTVIPGENVAIGDTKITDRQITRTVVGTFLGRSQVERRLSIDELRGDCELLRRDALNRIDVQNKAGRRNRERGNGCREFLSQRKAER